MSQLLLRIFAICEDIHQAVQLGERIQQQLHPLKSTPSAPFERYWKIPEYFYLEFTLSPPTPENYEQLIENHPGNWQRWDSELQKSAVWVKSEGTQFLIPEIQWVEIQWDAQSPPFVPPPDTAIH